MNTENLKPYRQSGTKREQVEEMFNNIADSYDIFNKRMSLGINAMWRRKAISFLQHQSAWPLNLLDVATGTGDLALEAAAGLGPEEIIGIDISDEMMERARLKVEAAGLSDVISIRKEDCEHMSFRNNYFDAVTSSFALRNFQNLDACLAEMYRVLNRDGFIVLLELAVPEHFPMRQIYKFYQKVVFRYIGKHMLNDRMASDYLPKSMEMFPHGAPMIERLQRIGFKDVQYRRLFTGMCVMYTGKK